MAQRLFFALRPDAAATADIIAVQQQLPADKLRIYSAENLHQTLAFLGQFADCQLMELISACQSIDLPPFSMQFEQLNYWPQPKVLCLLAQDIPDELMALVAVLKEIAGQFNVTLDQRPYRPHITLARKASETITLDFAPISFTADEFVLMQSQSTDNGPIYKPLYCWPLTAVG
ncbi:MAG: RNA 2',3'-cyclic phosphodiesterase [Methylophaga sp.]|nr:RNA 2',3'-cyclic phosphodiesterase [Methylophaga sp.]